MFEILKEFFKIPISIFKIDKASLIIWFIFSIVMGLSGPMYNLYFVDKSFTEIMINECVNGTFYTFSIAIIASSICNIVLQMYDALKTNVESKTSNFNITLLFMLLAGFCIWYVIGSSYSKYTMKTVVNLNIQNSCSEIPYIPQIIYIFVSTIFAIYIFCFSFVTKYPELFPHLSDKSYAKKEKSKVDKLIQNKKNLDDPLV